MTTEIKRMVEPGDLLAIEVECSQRHAKTSRMLNNWQQSIRMCTNCHSTWQDSSAALGILEEIANRLLQLSTFSEKEPAFYRSFRDQAGGA